MDGRSPFLAVGIYNSFTIITGERFCKASGKIFHPGSRHHSRVLDEPDFPGIS
jgi:hypothetical protein